MPNNVPAGQWIADHAKRTFGERVYTFEFEAPRTQRLNCEKECLDERQLSWLVGEADIACKEAKQMSDAPARRQDGEKE